LQTNSSNQSSRLVLGTAQLGMSYGIANRSGQPNLNQAKEIIRIAWENGIKEYDTAQGYGESEKVLGNVIRSLGLGSELKVISKLDPNLDHLDKTAMEKAVRGSLARLNVSALYGLLIHREKYLDLWGDGLGDILKSFISQGLTEHIGVSVYSPEKAELTLGMDEISIIQIPSNIFDRRFEHTAVFEAAKRRQKQTYVRSVFLQGLVMMSVDKLPTHIQFTAPVLITLDKLCQELGLTRQALALGYAKHAYPHAQIVFGVETPEQVEENMVYWNENVPPTMVDHVREVFNNLDERILNPVFWSQ
jgi:aryl-alcohol dehydrogenase-like predicted oxidoreductase